MNIETVETRIKYETVLNDETSLLVGFRKHQKRGN